VIWSFLVQLVASLVIGNRWLLDSSLFHHIAPAPAAPPNWGSVAWLAALGLAAMVVGVVGFTRRDLVSA
jgi:ABC-2 type transport system permease protein